MKVRGSKHDTGEVLRLLLDLGARPAGHWQSGHMSPIDAKAPDFETPQHEDGRGNTQSRYDYPFGITVNALGVRFFDEGEAQHSYTYAKTGRAVLGQPGARAFQIYDQKGLKCFRYPHHKATFVEADTIAELAAQDRPRADGARRIRSRNSTAPFGRHAVRSDAGRTARPPKASPFRNPTGRSASTSRRSAPIRSPAASPSPSAASR